MGGTCAQCGWDAAAPAGALTRRLRRAPEEFGRLLHDEVVADRDALTRRPQPAVWSALEYVAHTRDAVAWYEQRVRRVLSEPGARLEAFDWDRACEERRYRDEDPGDALSGLGAACRSLAGLLEGLDADAWDQAGIGSGGGPRTVLVLARRAVHEVHHHLWDVGRCLAAARPTPPSATRPPAPGGM